MVSCCASRCLLVRRSCDAYFRRAVDAWGVGCFIQEIFTGRKLTRTEELRELSHIPQVRRGPRSFLRAPTHDLATLHAVFAEALSATARQHASQAPEPGIASGEHAVPKQAGASLACLSDAQSSTHARTA